MNSRSAPAALTRELAASAGAEDCRVVVDGIGIRYLRAGAGPPLLLLHGLMAYSYSWRHNLRALAAARTVYAPDLPGTGYSDRTKFDCSFSGIARVMLRFMDALGLRDADLLGTSHGGAVAMMMAAQDAQAGSSRIRRLILVDPVNPFSKTGRKRVRFFSSPIGAFLVLKTPLLKSVRGPILERLYADPSRIAPGVAEAYAAPFDTPGSMEHVVRMISSWIADVDKLRAAVLAIAEIPTLLIWGSRDRAVPMTSAGPLQQQFRDARLVLLDGVGHLPYEEAPEEFNRAVLEFLKEP